MNFLGQLMLDAALSLLTFTSSGANNSSLYYRSSPDISKPTRPESTSVRLSLRFDRYLDEVFKNRKAAFAALRMPCMETVTLRLFEERSRDCITIDLA